MTLQALLPNAGRGAQRSDRRRGTMWMTMRATRTVTMTTTATTMKTEAEIRVAGDTVAVGGGGGK